jgi:hypothetical protein
LLFTTENHSRVLTFLNFWGNILFRIEEDRWRVSYLSFFSAAGVDLKWKRTKCPSRKRLYLYASHMMKMTVWKAGKV